VSSPIEDRWEEDFDKLAKENAALRAERDALLEERWRLITIESELVAALKAELAAAKEYQEKLLEMLSASDERRHQAVSRLHDAQVKAAGYLEHEPPITYLELYREATAKLAAARAEIAELSKAHDHQASRAERWRDDAKEAQQERDTARAEIERLKKVIDRRNHDHVMRRTDPC
jgi:chromosome segregation ATPase